MMLLSSIKEIPPLDLKRSKININFSIKLYNKIMFPYKKSLSMFQKNQYDFVIYLLDQFSFKWFQI